MRDIAAEFGFDGYRIDTVRHVSVQSIVDLETGSLCMMIVPCGHTLQHSLITDQGLNQLMLESWPFAHEFPISYFDEAKLVPNRMIHFRKVFFKLRRRDPHFYVIRISIPDKVNKTGAGKLNTNHHLQYYSKWQCSPILTFLLLFFLSQFADSPRVLARIPISSGSVLHRRGC